MAGIQSQGFFDPSNRPQFPTSRTGFGDLGFAGLTAVNPLLGIGAKLGGGLIGLLGGKSKREKQRGGLFDFLTQLRGRQAIDPRSIEGFKAQTEQSLIPFFNRFGRTRATKVGTGSGVGVGEALRQGGGQFGSQLLDIMRRIQEINARRPLDIARTQAGLV